LKIEDRFMVKFVLNGQQMSSDAEADTPLLWVVRDDLKLTGAKFGCGIAECGACTMLVDGMAVRACITAISDVAGSKVTTIEGLSGKVSDAVHEAWQKLDVVQCGYCQSGQIVSAVALLTDTPAPSDADIDSAMSGNICRCNTYQRIRAAIHAASARLKG
jgi:isoquinoline 1-oxidoreductase alpha subunit